MRPAIVILALTLWACDERTYVTDTEVDSEPDTFDSDASDAEDAEPEPPPLPPDECQDPDPPPTGPRVDFDIDCDPCLSTGETPMDCNVHSLTEDSPGHVIMLLQCRDGAGGVGSYNVETFSDIPMPLALAVDTPVYFRFFEWGPTYSWIPWFFSLKTHEGKLLLAGIDAYTPWPNNTPGDWYDPITIDYLDGLCELEPLDCFDLERIALEVDYDGTRKWVFDSSTIVIGSGEPYYVQVDNAEILRNPSCGSTPPGRVMMLIERIPEI
jgi:hypothetical protein